MSVVLREGHHRNRMSIVVRKRRRQHGCLILLLVLFGGFTTSSKVLPQSLDSTDYFPLEVNNQWIYFFFEDVPFFFPDTTKVLQTQVIKDTVYYVTSVRDPLDRFAGFPKYIRKDSVGNVYGRLAGKDQLVYNVKADSGQQWQVNLSSDTVAGAIVSHKYTITMKAKMVTVVTYTGLFQNCLQFLLRTDLTEASYYVWLSPGVGIVRIDGWGNAGFWSLKRAVIDSNLISSQHFRFWLSLPGPSSNTSATQQE